MVKVTQNFYSVGSVLESGLADRNENNYGAL